MMDDIVSRMDLGNDDTAMTGLEPQQRAPGDMMAVDVAANGLPSSNLTPDGSISQDASSITKDKHRPSTPPSSVYLVQTTPGSMASSNQRQSEGVSMDANSHLPNKRRGRRNSGDWGSQKHLFCPQAGTTTLGANIIEGFKGSGIATDHAIVELSKYKDYELENFTFLQEIIPNLFLGSVRSLDPGVLEEAGITRVLTVMSSNPHKDKPLLESQTNISREYIMMKDSANFQSHRWYQTTSAIIDSALHAGERILIHWYESYSLTLLHI